MELTFNNVLASFYIVPYQYYVGDRERVIYTHLVGGLFGSYCKRTLRFGPVALVALSDIPLCPSTD